MKKRLSLPLLFVLAVALLALLSSCSVVTTVKDGVGNAYDKTSDAVGGVIDSVGDFFHRVTRPFRDDCAVGFEAAGGTAVDGDELKVGDLIPEPTAPTRPGYDFTGWYDGDRLWDFAEDTLTADLTLVAGWTPVVYDVTYELAGGTNASSNPATFDAVTGNVTLAAPERTGYVFAGWLLDGEPVTEIDVTLYRDVTLVASWEVIRYEITYELSGGTNATVNPPTYDAATGNVTLGEAIRPGYTFTGWTLDGTPVTEIAIDLYRDITLVATWEVVVYDVTYDLGGGTNASSNPPTFDAATGNVTLAVPGRPGYAFAGWLLDGTPVTEINVTLYRDITLVATWEVVVYDITYDLGGGTNASSNPLTFDALTGNVTLAVPGRPGYAFAGWLLDGTPVTEIDVTLYRDVTLVASWEVILYDITYELGGGANATVNPPTFDAATGNVLLGDATRPGYDFKGWTLDGQSVTEVAIDLYRDITLVANWSATVYEITYELSGGTNADGALTTFTVEGENVILGNATRPGYDFSGWYEDADCTKPITVINVNILQNITVYAKWELVKFEITYDLGGGVNAGTNPPTFDVVTGNVTLGNATRPGYDFEGWMMNGKAVTEINVDLLQNITLVASWKATVYEITYELDGGTNPDGTRLTFTIEEGNVLLDSVRPTRPGYTFSGWYSDKDCTVAITVINVTILENITIYADWTAIKYEIVYELGADSDTVTHTNPPTFDAATGNVTLGDAIRPGYDFKGWELNGETVTVVNVELLQNITLVANWSATVYEINYQLGTGGTTPDGTRLTFTVEEENVILDSIVPTRPGYNFKGWYTSSDYSEASVIHVINVTILQNITIYAKWELVKFEIKYELGANSDNATNENPITFDVENGNVTLATPAKGGYDFTGWYSDPECTKPITVIDITDITILQNITIYAKWSVTNYSITYVLNGGNAHPNKQTYNIEGDPIILEPATRAGYTFVAWHYAEDLSDAPVTTVDLTQCKDIRLYAEWRPNTYTIVYDLAGGTAVDNPTTYTSTDGTILLLTPKKSGYIFGGFYPLPQQSTNRILTIEASRFANLEDGATLRLYAYWLTEKEAYDVESVSTGCKITQYRGAENHVVVPASLWGSPVVTIGAEAFRDRDSILSLTLPDSVKTIEANAFYSCSNMKEIHLGSKLETIGGAAFGHCASLTSLTLPSTVKTITNAAFGGCSSLESLTLPFLDSTLGYIFGRTSYVGGVSVSQRLSASSASTSTYYIPATLTSVTLTNAEWLNIAAFQNCTMLKEVSLDGSLTSVSSYAFENCTALEAASLPDSITQIGNYAFSGCSSLKEIALPAGLTEIRDYAFKNCSRLEDVTVPAGVTKYGNAVFQGCASIKSITFPFTATTTRLGQLFGSTKYEGSVSAQQRYSASSYNNLATAYLPAGLTSVTVNGGTPGFGAFSGCTLLEEILLPASLTTLSDYAFDACTSLTSITIPNGIKILGKAIFHKCSNLETVTYAEDIEAIGEMAFYDCEKLTSVRLPATVTSLGASAFYNCRGLTGTVTVPAGITAIPRSLFNTCVGITAIVLPEGLTSIGDSAFSGCKALSSVSIPEGVTEIGNSAFSGCLNIAELVLPEHLVKIGNYAFMNCVGIKSVTLSASLTSLGTQAFRGCTEITEIILLAPSLADFSADSAVFGGAGYGADGNGTGLSVTIGKDVLRVPAYLFTGYTTKTTNPTTWTVKVVSLTFEEGSRLETIGAGAFRCAEITSLSIPASVTSFGQYAFADCASLTSLTVPFIGTAESNGTKLESVISSSMLNQLEELTVLRGKIPDYQLGKLTALREVTLGEGVTSIGLGVFSQSAALTKVTILGPITEIPNSTFSDCTSLTTVVLPSTVKTIGYSAFEDCTSLASLTIPAGVTSLGNNLFKNTAITSAVIPAGVTKIEAGLFSGCKQLASVTFAEGCVITSVGNSAFSGCSSLTSIALPEGVTSLGQSAFAGCGITAFTVPSGVTEIPNSLFSGCSSLKTLVIHGGVTKIGKTPLLGCVALEELTLPFVGTVKRDTVVSNDRAEVLGALFTTVGTYNNTLGEGVTVQQIYMPYSNTTKSDKYSLPAGLKKLTVLDGTLPFGALSNLTMLETVILGDGVVLSPYALYGCSGITSLTLPKTAAELPKYALSGLENLPSITLPQGLVTIGESALSNLKSITSLTLPETLETIGKLGLSGCSSLTSLTIPDGVTSMAATASDGFLKGCISLKTLVLPYLGSSIDRATSLGMLFGPGATSGNNSVQQVTAIEQRIETPTYKYNNYAIPDSLTHITVKGGAIALGAFSGMGSAESPITVILGEGVTSVGVAAFAYYTYIDSVTLPEGITAINNYTFSDSYVKTVTFLGDVTSIGKYAFYQCKNLTSVTSTAKVTSIGDLAFYYCESLTSLDVSSATTLGKKTFAISGLTTLHLAEGLTVVPQQLCMNCYLLTEVTIPSTATSIESYAFSGCKKLASVRYNAASLTDLTANNNGVFNDTATESDGITLTVGKAVTRIPAYLFGGSSNMKLVAIVYEDGCSLTEIGSYAFRGAQITEFVFPETLTTIGSHAFYGCDFAPTLIIPSTVTTIGSSAFAACAPTTVTLPHLGDGFASDIITFGEGATVTILGGRIAGSAFAGSSRIKTVILGDAVTEIAGSLFSGCKNLESVTFGAGITVIPENTCNNCAALTTVVFRGDVTSIGFRAFYGTSSLTSITLPDTLLSVGQDAFRNSGLTGELDLKSVETVGVSAFAYTAITGITMPAIKTLADDAFAYCAGLTSIVIPDTCTSLGQRVFGQCTSATSITVGKGVAIIPRNAFTGCTALASLTLSEGLEQIESYAFYACRALTTLVIPDSVTRIGAGAFKSCVGITSLTVPFIGETAASDGYSCYLAYIFTEGYGSEGTEVMQGSLKYLPPALTTVTVTKDTSIGTGAFQNSTMLVSVTFLSNVNAIGMNAFSGCTALESVTFHGLTGYISNEAFRNCTSLKEITLPTGVAAIGNYVFSGCTALTTVTLPASGLQSIGESAFEGCTSLVSFDLDGGVQYLHARAFAGCTALKTVVLAEGSAPLWISDAAFSGCTGLTSLTINGTLSNIGKNAFYNCTALTEICYNARGGRFNAQNEVFGNAGIEGDGIRVTFGKNVTEVPANIFFIRDNGTASSVSPKIVSISFLGDVTSIGDYAFRGLASLTSITLPASLTEMGTSVFYGCSSLTEVTVPASVSRLGLGVFGGCEALASIVFEEPDAWYTANYDGTPLNPVTGLEDPAAAAALYKDDRSLPNSAAIIRWLQ